MGKKKGRQQQSSNTPVAVDSSESGDAQESTVNPSQVSSNKPVCQHVTRAVDINNLKKNITAFENQACARCTKLGVTPVLGDGTWFCLRCGNRSCSLKHSEEHHETPHSDSHCLAIQLPPFIVRCHSCKTELPDDFNKKLNFCITNLKQMNIRGQLDLKREDSPSAENKDKEQEVLKIMETNSEKLEEKKKIIAKPPSPPAVRGLSNLGNTCFFNSVLQCLARTPNLIDILKQMNAQDKPIDITLKSGKHLVGKLDKWDALSESLVETMESVLSAGSVFSPYKLLNLLREKCPQFEGYDQHDAHELLRHLLDAVRTNDLKRYRKVMLAEMGLNSKVNRQEVSEEKRKQLKQLDHEVCEAVTLVPEHVFKGMLVSTLECQECNSTSQCIESFLDLSLPVMSEKPQPPSCRRKNNSTVTLEEKGGSQVSKHQLKKERKMARKQKGKKHCAGGSTGASNRKDPANQADPIPENDEKGSDAEGDIEDNEEAGCCEDKRHESGYSSEKLGGSARETPSVSSASDSARASPSSITDTLDSLHLQQPGERPPIPLPPPPPHHQRPPIPLPYYERSPPAEGRSSPVSEETSPVSLPLLEEPLILTCVERPSEDIPLSNPENSSPPLVPLEERLFLSEERAPMPLSAPEEGASYFEGQRHTSPVPKVRPPMPLPSLEERSPVDTGAQFSCVCAPHINDHSLSCEHGLYICTGLPPVKQVPAWLSYRMGLENKWTVEQDAVEKAKYKVETNNEQWDHDSGIILDEVRPFGEQKFHSDGSPDFTKLLLRNSKYPEIKMKIKSGLTVMKEDPGWKERLDRFQSWSAESGKCHSNKKGEPPVFESRFDTDFRLYCITEGTNEEAGYRMEGVKGGEGGDPDLVNNHHPQRPTVLQPPQDVSVSGKNKKVQKAEEHLSKEKEVVGEENSFPTLFDVSRIAEGVLAHVSAYLQKEKDSEEASSRKDEERGSPKVSPDTEDDGLSIVRLYDEEAKPDIKPSPSNNAHDSDDIIIEPIGDFTVDRGNTAAGVDDEGLGLNEESAPNEETHLLKGDSSLGAMAPVSSTPTVISSRYLHSEESECSVLTCLNQFTSIELMTGNNKVGCSTCTARLHKGSKDSKTVYTMSTKQLLIKSAPPVLILHLKRFQVQMYSFRKLSKHVSFPMVLDLAPFCVDSQKLCQGDEEPEENKEILYTLYGVVEHSGTFNGGHYVAYVKVDEGDSGGRRWFCISDSHVLEVTESRVLSSQAYLLFYRRMSPPLTT